MRRWLQAVAPDSTQRSFEHSLRRYVDGRAVRAAEGAIYGGGQPGALAVGITDMRAVSSRGMWTAEGWGQNFEAVIAAGNFQGGIE